MNSVEEWNSKLDSYPDVHELAQRQWRGDRVLGVVLAAVLGVAKTFMRQFPRVLRFIAQAFAADWKTQMPARVNRELSREKQPAISRKALLAN